MSELLIVVLPSLITAIGAILGGGGVIKHVLDKRDKEQEKREQEKNTRLEETLDKHLAPLNEKIDNVQNDLKEHIEKDGADKADQMRTRILRFSDELTHNIRPSKEHFDDMLETVDKYEFYCEQNHQYINSKADASIELIREKYKQLMMRGEL